MANSLNMDLRGKKVVVREYLLPGTSEQERTFTCEDGFGCDSFTSGKSITGEWVSGGKDRISGYDVEKIVE